MSPKPKSVLRNLHRFGGGIAFVLITSFWLSTIVVELTGSIDQIVAVKTAIAWGLIALIPALAATGASGFKLAGCHIAGILVLKLRRMKLIAANGILVLAPCAIGLAMLANAGQMDGAFVAIQAVELIAGFVNLTLIGLNIRDGLRVQRPTRSEVHG